MDHLPLFLVCVPHDFRSRSIRLQPTIPPRWNASVIGGFIRDDSSAWNNPNVHDSNVSGDSLLIFFQIAHRGCCVRPSNANRQLKVCAWRKWLQTPVSAARWGQQEGAPPICSTNRGKQHLDFKWQRASCRCFRLAWHRHASIPALYTISAAAASGCRPVGTHTGPVLL